ncbi:hypothetical protein EVAR_42654_1 [Eumeta japonica]|uniref:Organic cation transporter protein n=1 Tax=Eumeta variegata TaxID=151549 RepID=A0A4C1YPI5_EUMVA|nr:hypothetical protein EVAR_42654_1 [Eumeta japonica]
MAIIDTEVRSKVQTLHHVPFVLGILTVPLFSYLTRTYDGYWLTISLPSCLLVSYYWLIPEPPRWLLAVGRIEQARKILIKAAKTNNISENKVTAAIESHETLIPSAIRKIDATEKQKSYGVMDLIITPNMRLKTICIVFNWLKCGMMFFGIEHYLAHISDNVLGDLAISGTNCLNLLDQFGQSCALSSPCVTFSSCLPAPRATDSLLPVSRVSRLKILIVANVIAGISLLLIIPFYYSDIAKLVLVTVAFTCMTISFPTTYLYTGELFPSVVRNIGFSVCSVASKTGSIFAPFLIACVDDLACRVIPVVFGMGPILGAILCKCCLRQ